MTTTVDWNNWQTKRPRSAVSPLWAPSTAGLATSRKELKALLELMEVIPPLIINKALPKPPVIPIAKPPVLKSIRKTKSAR